MCPQGRATSLDGGTRGKASRKTGNSPGRGDRVQILSRPGSGGVEPEPEVDRFARSGLPALAGYRLAPWRGLELTPHLGLSWRTEVDLEGRLPAARRGGLTFGLNAGWMF